MAKKKDLMDKIVRLEAAGKNAEAEKAEKALEERKTKKFSFFSKKKTEEEAEAKAEEMEDDLPIDLAVSEPEVDDTSVLVEKPEPETEIEPEPVSEPETEPEPELETEPEAEPEPEDEPETAEKLLEMAAAMRQYADEKIESFEKKLKKYRAEIEEIEVKAEKMQREEAEAKAKAEAEAKAKAEAEAKAKAEAEAKAKAEAEAVEKAKVANGHPGKAYRYLSSTQKVWKVTPFLWKADQFSGGNWRTVGAWYDADDNLHHLLDEEEADRYFPDGL